jgi:hypothetical protein
MTGKAEPQHQNRQYKQKHFSHRFIPLSKLDHLNI